MKTGEGAQAPAVCLDRNCSVISLLAHAQKRRRISVNCAPSLFRNFRLFCVLTACYTDMKKKGIGLSMRYIRETQDHTRAQV